MRRGSRQSRHSSTFTWYYRMTADPTLKSTTKHILGVLALKKHNEVELDGESVVKVTASYPEIAELTGLHKDTVHDHMHRAERAGWVEVIGVGDGSGRRKNTYILAYPGANLVGRVTDTSSVVSPIPRRSCDLDLVGRNFADPQVEATQNAQVLEVSEGTESTGTASRTRVTRAPRAPSEKKNGRAGRDKAIRDCGLCDDRGGVGLRAGPFISCPHDKKRIDELERSYEMQESEGA
jgi:hypothetical protein